ncbi:MAG: aminotransferase class V-fold PLP-dependent enzyme [Candidatus Lokiarchaeota archaeon]|nr:aminotransferase class V-fold PLP-dependent enzyme [Candidatus Lokiarchaeota archaeon]
MSELDIRSDFSILRNNPSLAFFDSASTTLVPDIVADSVSNFLKNTVISTRRGAYSLAVQGGNQVESTRMKLAELLDIDSSRISFNNSIASSITSFCLGFDWIGNRKKKIIISEGEENSISVPLMHLAKILKLEVDFVRVNEFGEIELDSLYEKIDDSTGIVALSHVMLGTGNPNPVDMVSRMTRDFNAVLISDLTQSIGFTKKPLSSFGADICLFSGNIGFFGPPGVVIQCIDSELGREIYPGILGGSSVSDVRLGSFDVALQPDKFETGILNVPGIIGLGAGLEYSDFLRKNGFFEHMSHLRNHLTNRIDETDIVNMYGSHYDTRTIFGLSIGSDNSINCHDVALFLDESNIYVRSGLLCAHPLIRSLNPEGIIQISLHCYNSITDIDKLMDTLILIGEQLI